MGLPIEQMWFDNASVGTWNALAIVGITVLLWAALSERACRGLVLACWIIAGISMTAVNKKAAQTFDATLLLVIVQMLIADVVIIGSHHKSIAFGRWRDIWAWMVVPLSFASILATGLWSLKEATLSTVLIFRNMLPLMTFVAERYLIDSSAAASQASVLAMLTTLVGTVVYGFWNVSVTPRGACLVLLNDAIMVFDKLVQRRLLQDPEFTVTLPLCMVLNNSVGVVPIFAVALTTGEVWQWSAAVDRTSASSWLLIALSGILGCSLGYLALQVQRQISATTFLVLQNFSKLLGICIGITLLGDPISGISAVGCGLSLLGSGWYSYLNCHIRGRATTWRSK